MSKGYADEYTYAIRELIAEAKAYTKTIEVSTVEPPDSWKHAMWEVAALKDEYPHREFKVKGFQRIGPLGAWWDYYPLAA